MAEPSAESKLAEAKAVLEAVERALDGESVTDFMESFPVVMKARNLYLFARSREPAAEGAYGLIVVVKEEGEYKTAWASMEGGFEGTGTSRKEKSAVAYALEGLAEKVKAS